VAELDERERLPGTHGHLRMPADVNQLAAVRAFIRQEAKRAGADPDTIADVVQAVDESVTNVIVHGYGGAEGEIEVEVERAGASLIVRLRDQARPFDPTLVPDPDTSLPLERRPLGGMGVFLTRELTDAVSYRRTDDGNELTLVKKSIDKESIDQQEGERVEHHSQP
jgi:serine/threonine-protein kinase RsbW